MRRRPGPRGRRAELRLRQPQTIALSAPGARRARAGVRARWRGVHTASRFGPPRPRRDLRCTQPLRNRGRRRKSCAVRRRECSRTPQQRGKKRLPPPSPAAGCGRRAARGDSASRGARRGALHAGARSSSAALPRAASLAGVAGPGRGHAQLWPVAGSNGRRRGAGGRLRTPCGSRGSSGSRRRLRSAGRQSASGCCYPPALRGGAGRGSARCFPGSRRCPHAGAPRGARPGRVPGAVPEAPPR